RAIGGRWRRDPQVLADLDVQHEIAVLRMAEDEVGAEGRCLAGEPDLAHGDRVARRELPALVELAVVRQVGLRHYTEQLALRDQRRAVEEPSFARDRQPDERRRAQVLRA